MFVLRAAKGEGAAAKGGKETILTRARSFDWSSYVRDLPYQKWNLLYLLFAAVGFLAAPFLRLKLCSILRNLRTRLQTGI
jgi:hypothetical protein